MSHFAQIEKWLAVGDLMSCDPDKVCVHIYRNDFDQVCNGGGLPGSIKIEYKDGDEIREDMFVALDELSSKITQEYRSVLVHCHAGACRSPIIAAYLLHKVAKVDIFSAIAKVSEAVWRDRRLAVNITHKPLQSILNRTAS